MSAASEALSSAPVSELTRSCGSLIYEDTRSETFRIDRVPESVCAPLQSENACSLTSRVTLGSTSVFF